MKKSVRDLLELQGIDMRIRALNVKLQAIPLERARLVADFEVVRKQYNASLAAVKKIQQRIRENETEVASEQGAHQQLLVKSGTIKKQAEYEALMAQINNCKIRISNLETEQINLLDELEKSQEAAHKMERRYKATGRSAQAEVKELDALKSKVEAEIAEKRLLSARLEENVSRANLDAYRPLLASGKGEPLSRITENGLCSNCALKLPPSTLIEAAKANIVFCDNCSFMLYDPNGKEVQ